jgi:hypothetical protein
LPKLPVEKAPRALLTTESPDRRDWTSELAGDGLPGGRRPASRTCLSPARGLLGLLITFGAIPRMVFGPILLVIDGATFLPRA